MMKINTTITEDNAIVLFTPTFPQDGVKCSYRFTPKSNQDQTNENGRSFLASRKLEVLTGRPTSNKGGLPLKSSQN